MRSSSSSSSSAIASNNQALRGDACAGGFAWSCVGGVDGEPVNEERANTNGGVGCGRADLLLVLTPAAAAALADVKGG